MVQGSGPVQTRFESWFRPGSRGDREPHFLEPHVLRARALSLSPTLL